MPDSNQHSVPRTDAPELVDRINWYVACLEDRIKGNVVRGLAEAEAGFDSAMSEVASLFEQLEAAVTRLQSALDESERPGSPEGVDPNVVEEVIAMLRGSKPASGSDE